MYVLGGIYTDAYIPYQRSFASLWNLSKDYLYLVQDAGEGDSVQISTMAAPRGCHYFQLCLQQSVKNIKERAYRDSPYSVTGPVLAGECLKKYLGVEGVEVGGKYIPVNQSDENACIDYRLMRIDGEAALRLSRAAFFDANEQYLFPYKLNQKRKNWESLQHYYNAWHARDIYH